jgi:hypothetical protein
MRMDAVLYRYTRFIITPFSYSRVSLSTDTTGYRGCSLATRRVVMVFSNWLQGCPADCGALWADLTRVVDGVGDAGTARDTVKVMLF